MNISCNNDIPALLAHSSEDVAEQRKAKKRDRNRKWRADNPDYHKAWRADNPDYHKAYRESHPEKAAASYKAWYNANPEKAAASTKAYQAETKQIILDHYGSRCNCPTCKSGPNLVLEVDHIIPFAESPHKHAHRSGPALWLYIIKHQCWEDFQLLCRSCNRLKHHHGTCNCGITLGNIDE